MLTLNGAKPLWISEGNMLPAIKKYMDSKNCIIILLSPKNEEIRGQLVKAGKLNLNHLENLVISLKYDCVRHLYKIKKGAMESPGVTSIQAKNVRSYITWEIPEKQIRNDSCIWKSLNYL